MVDRTLILRKLSNLEAYLAQIKEYTDISLDTYMNEWKTQRIIERTLQMMIETCSDVAGHIIADQKYRVPTGYADTFKVLEENQILGHSLAVSLSKMAKLLSEMVR
jgi:uncharacterized protein YutE (UPF0331/DUF86 family)